MMMMMMTRRIYQRRIYLLVNPPLVFWVYAIITIIIITIIIIAIIIITIISIISLTYQVSVTPANADKALGSISRGEAY